jgi:hypothetical protein
MFYLVENTIKPVYQSSFSSKNSQIVMLEQVGGIAYY